MDIEEKKEKLLFLQKFFFKSFLISIFLMLVSLVLCIYMHDTQLAFVNKYFPLTEPKEYNEIVILLFGIWKILVVEFTLVPALAIFAIRKCCKGECKKV